MKRFSFGLEKVLELRKYREEESRVELGRAVGVLSEIENGIEAAGRERTAAARRRFAEAVPGNSQILAWDYYIRRLDRETEKLMQDAAQAELVVEEKRESYLEAARELKVMEKLKEKREKEYQKEVFAAETRELDDLFRGKKEQAV